MVAPFLRLLTAKPLRSSCSFSDIANPEGSEMLGLTTFWVPVLGTPTPNCMAVKQRS